MAWPRQTSKQRFVKTPGTVRRSGLEDKVEAQLKSSKIEYEYEEQKIAYVLECSYLPDFKLSNGIYIECKGEFDSADRRKHKAIKQQHPELDIRFIFSNSSTKIGKGSPTSYAMWCEYNGFQYADKFIPEEWLQETKGKGR